MRFDVNKLPDDAKIRLVTFPLGMDAIAVADVGVPARIIVMDASVGWKFVPGWRTVPEVSVAKRPLGRPGT